MEIYRPWRMWLRDRRTAKENPNDLDAAARAATFEGLVFPWATRRAAKRLETLRVPAGDQAVVEANEISLLIKTDRSAALQASEELVKKYPSYVGARQVRASALLVAGKPQDALTILEEVKPQKFETLTIAMAANLKLGRNREAQAMYEERCQLEERPTRRWLFRLGVRWLWLWMLSLSFWIIGLTPGFGPFHIASAGVFVASMVATWHVWRSPRRQLVEIAVLLVGILNALWLHLTCALCSEPPRTFHTTFG